MPDERGGPATAVSPVRVWGILRGRELAFDGTLTVGDAAVTVAPLDGGAPVVVRYASIEGARAGAAGASLYLAGGDDVLEVVGEGAAAAQLAGAIAELTRRACALPELTRHLRGFGSQRARPGSDHDRFFGPLLDARRAAEAHARPFDQPRAYDATALRAAAEEALAGFAAARFPESAPDRRALDAELDEIALPLWASLDALEAAAAAVRASPEDARFLRWHEWAAALRAVYAAADRVWVAALPALADSRGRGGRLWRRVLGRR
jgi:hypothetical protein